STAVGAISGTTASGTVSGIGGDDGLAQKIVNAVDTALKAVDTARSNLGAIQNRFESTITNVNNTINNLSNARGRIQDADYAVEVSNMTKANILQQAGTSVPSQANQAPLTGLSLMR
ncbi:flagellin, partial [Pectobacterium carotovorum]|uniref:flagellin n=1 Tax=Pectobacterium carotovorum TaxID=554 RepID=UPI0021E0EB2F